MRLKKISQNSPRGTANQLDRLQYCLSKCLLSVGLPWKNGSPWDEDCLRVRQVHNLMMQFDLDAKHYQNKCGLRIHHETNSTALMKTCYLDWLRITPDGFWRRTARTVCECPENLKSMSTGVKENQQIVCSIRICIGCGKVWNQRHTHTATSKIPGPSLLRCPRMMSWALHSFVFEIILYKPTKHNCIHTKWGAIIFYAHWKTKWANHTETLSQAETKQICPCSCCDITSGIVDTNISKEQQKHCHHQSM